MAADQPLQLSLCGMPIVGLSNHISIHCPSSCLPCVPRAQNGACSILDGPCTIGGLNASAQYCSNNTDHIPSREVPTWTWRCAPVFPAAVSPRGRQYPCRRCPVPASGCACGPCGSASAPVPWPPPTMHRRPALPRTPGQRSPSQHLTVPHMLPNVTTQMHLLQILLTPGMESLKAACICHVILSPRPIK